MHRPSLLTGAVLVAAGLVALSGCGSSSSSSTSTSSSGGASSASSSSQSSASSSISLPGGSFCAQVTAAIAQFGQLGAGLQQAGTAPSLAGIKQLFAADAGVVDSLDSSAPSEIAADVHALRAALDQANSQVQGATTLEQLSTAFTPLSAPAIATAGAHISAYVKTACGISSTSTT